MKPKKAERNRSITCIAPYANGKEMSKETKTCCVCLVDKPVSEFRSISKGSQSRRYSCKECHLQYNREWRFRNKKLLSEAAKLRRKTRVASTIVNDCRGSDKKHGRGECDLDEDFVESKIQNPCAYCGESGLRMTLDRIDNDLPHTKSNVVQACIRCNYMRNSIPYAAWLCFIPALREAREKGLFGDWTGRCR